MRKQLWHLKRKILDKYLLFKTNRLNLVPLSKLKDIHKGKRCFIIGNGPSLRMEDLDKLKNEICFAANKIYVAFPNTLWRPTYYVIQDEIMIIEELEDLKRKVQAKQKFIYGEYLIRNNIHLEDWSYFHLLIKNFNPKLPQFSTDISKGIYEGMTVTYAELQMAIYMGFSEIYLLGIDFNYNSGNSGYFSPEYMNNKEFGKDFNLPDLDSSYLAYKAAQEYASKNGVKIFNATRTTKLDVFERVDFDSLRF